MRDPDLVVRAQRAATALEAAWNRWRTVHGLGADPLPPVSSYVGYSLEEPWGQPRVVFGVDAEEAEQLAAILDGHDCVGPLHAEVAGSEGGQEPSLERRFAPKLADSPRLPEHDQAEVADRVHVPAQANGTAGEWLAPQFAAPQCAAPQFGASQSAAPQCGAQQSAAPADPQSAMRQLAGPWPAVHQTPPQPVERAAARQWATEREPAASPSWQTRQVQQAVEARQAEVRAAFVAHWAADAGSRLTTGDEESGTAILEPLPARPEVSPVRVSHAFHPAPAGTLDPETPADQDGLESEPGEWDEPAVVAFRPRLESAGYPDEDDPAEDSDRRGHSSVSADVAGWIAGELPGQAAATDTAV
jgi:hypothetical protein